MFKVTWKNKETGKNHTWYFHNPKEMRELIWELRESKTEYKIKSINPFK
jgi:hypothetical protein|tara:strand:- start:3070 stop:3216 length:147 start_codon:yes stop_codon:yes gene_type:complete